VAVHIRVTRPRPPSAGQAARQQARVDEPARGRLIERHCAQPALGEIISIVRIDWTPAGLDDCLLSSRPAAR
jgi:hypothetical protein